MLVNGSIAYETDTTHKRKGHRPASDRAGSEDEGSHGLLFEIYVFINESNMKARVKATGDVVDVHRLCMSSEGDIWQKESSKEYFAHELDFDVKEPPKPRYNPDYWTRLEHQYAGMAMQGILSNPHIAFKDIKVDTVTDVYVDNIVKIAHALVEKLKEKEERK